MLISHQSYLITNERVIEEGEVINLGGEDGFWRMSNTAEIHFVCVDLHRTDHQLHAQNQHEHRNRQDG